MNDYIFSDRWLKYGLSSIFHPTCENKCVMKKHELVCDFLDAHPSLADNDYQSYNITGKSKDNTKYRYFDILDMAEVWIETLYTKI